MRLFVLLLICLINVQLFAQEYELKHFRPFKKYKYEYRIKPKCNSGPSEVQISGNRSSIDDSLLVINVRRAVSGLPLFFGFIEIRSVDCDTIYKGITNEEGKVVFDIIPGKYQLTTGYIGYKDVFYEFLIEENTQTTIDICLSCRYFMGIYWLYSRHRLKDSELLDIVVLLKAGVFESECFDKEDFYLMMEI